MEDESLAPLLSRLQAALGERIERVVASGGGLVVVVDALDTATEELVASSGGETPVAELGRARAETAPRDPLVMPKM